MSDGGWISQRTKRVDCCTSNLQPVDGQPVGDIWVCPVCRRRWRYAQTPRDPGLIEEGVTIRGPDGARFWRAYRARFIGRLGL